MGVLERRREERKEIIKKAGEFAREYPHRCTAIMIGSYARGDFNLWSDVDLIVVGEFLGNPVERLKNLDFPAGYEIIPLTVPEFNSLIESKKPLARDIVDQKVVLRDDFGLSRNLIPKKASGWK